MRVGASLVGARIGKAAASAIAASTIATEVGKSYVECGTVEEKRERGDKEMTLDEFIKTEKCPSSLPPPLQAMWYDFKGDWEKAHAIVQDASDGDSAWVHAYLHRKEGDLNNARYWYTRSGQPESKSELNQEWEQITNDLLRKI